ncbi:extradiol ring-cleavage dioxygenase [Plasticicumulans acidivorans]|uniref:Protocatechuate 4,5-dioxygenase alpha chain n=1 Tax=Plasticicumulans acidivorans TaxID=886464 RepID=A0A317MSF7_9GAMM|nr:extradiol ring-cleavage dioxygenase [Plasticicumulans acidivorans]PWV60100.1 protocatechuate 4,5-dioxygenase alpha chain [Plasticicumulans acidivorans]
MSRNVLEKLMHQLCVDRTVKQRFKEDLEGLLARYALTEDERDMLRRFDVAAMQKHGVNPMLTLGFWSENAPDRHPAAYMKALRGADSGGEVFSAALKH